MTSLVSNRLGMGELLVRNVNDYGDAQILFLNYIFFLKGSTISCFGPEGVPGGLLNTYCWIMSTFRLILKKIKI